jgi:hypothetical protein
MQLRFDVAVVHPAHIGEGGTRTDENVAVLLRGLGVLHGLLA